jgi:hypothetical protein
MLGSHQHHSGRAVRLGDWLNLSILIEEHKQVEASQERATRDKVTLYVCHYCGLQCSEPKIGVSY